MLSQAIPLLILTGVFGVYVLYGVLRYLYDEYVAYRPEPMELQDLIRDIEPRPTPFYELMNQKKNP